MVAGRGNEEGVRRLDEKPIGLGKAVAPFDPRLLGPLGRIGPPFDLSGLDVLRAVAEGLIDRNGEAFVARGLDPPRETIAAPGLELDAEQPDTPPITF